MDRKQVKMTIAARRENQPETNASLLGEGVPSSVLPHCIVCGKVPANGIMGGIFVKRQFICDCCETKIVNLDREKQSEEQYLTIAGKLKKIWKLA